MKIGYIPFGITWYEKEHIEEKLIWPEPINLAKFIDSKSLNLGYKFHVAQRCMACKILVLSLNENPENV
jgi:hypothetical protein